MCKVECEHMCVIFSRTHRSQTQRPWKCRGIALSQLIIQYTAPLTIYLRAEQSRRNIYPRGVVSTYAEVAPCHNLQLHSANMCVLPAASTVASSTPYWEKGTSLVKAIQYSSAICAAWGGMVTTRGIRFMSISDVAQFNARGTR